MSNVLVVNNSYVEHLGIKPGFNEFDGDLFTDNHYELSWMNRKPDAEESTTHRQIIPYVVLRCGSAVFSYRRKGNAEKRLEGMKSIGVGGHIDEATDDKVARLLGTCSDVTRWFATYLVGAMREVREEVHIDADDGPEFDVLDLAKPIDIIRDDSTAVGLVHLGVVHVVDLTTTKVTPREAEISEVGFRQLAQVARDRGAYEPWSQIVCDRLAAQP